MTTFDQSRLTGESRLVHVLASQCYYRDHPEANRPKPAPDEVERQRLLVTGFLLGRGFTETDIIGINQRAVAELHEVAIGDKPLPEPAAEWLLNLVINEQMPTSPKEVI